MQHQRFVFTYTDLDNPEIKITFGVRAKKYNQAKARVYDHLVTTSELNLEADRYKLEGMPSGKSADYEIVEEYVTEE
jgi:hypothetical protein